MAKRPLSEQELALWQAVASTVTPKPHGSTAEPLKMGSSQIAAATVTKVASILLHRAEEIWWQHVDSAK